MFYNWQFTKCLCLELFCGERYNIFEFKVNRRSILWRSVVMFDSFELYHVLNSNV